MAVAPPLLVTEFGPKQLPPIILPNFGLAGRRSDRRKSKKERDEEERKEKEGKGLSYLFSDGDPFEALENE